ncbi:MAG: DUF1007 family protein [Geminicoccaceae bacterium]|nr:MAG: DUF1007 family protein [Geminicoccaceae bacterium]
MAQKRQRSTREARPMCGRAAIAGVIGLGAVTAAEAHPHVWIEARSTLVVEAESLVGVRHSWTFDRLFSLQATADLVADAEGRFDAQALQPLADLYAETLPPWGFFTEVRATDAAAPQLRARPMRLEHDGQRLTLHLDLDLEPPLPLAAFDQVRVHDRTFYVSISYPAVDGARLQSETDCTLYLHRPGQLDPALVEALAAVPASVRELPPELAGRVRDAAHRIELACP